jgi:NAD(P)-dependent dehydrogenase (short-subunit alcohol dehydrogenase family)
MTTQRFAGKHIIITGAAGNFGREGCRYFVEQGAFVVGIDKDESKLRETVQYVVVSLQNNEIRGNCEGISCDVTNVESVNEAIEKAVDFFQRTSQRSVIDFLWNNAGYQGQIAPTLDYDPLDFANVMNINVTGMFIVLQAVAKRMAQEATNDSNSSTSGFSIVNTASVAGLRGTPAMVAYSSSKAAVLALTVCCAKVSS